MTLVSAVDFISVICSCLSFIFSSSLWFLLWRIRTKNTQLKQKCSAILLTTHVYYMAMCDVLISIWCILLYTPAVVSSTPSSIFNPHPSDLEMNRLSFTNISDNISCFVLAVLGQFAVISSAIWYILISYCLWRILFGHNPLAIRNSSSNKSYILSTSFLSKNTTQHHVRFHKKKEYEIAPLKEDKPLTLDTPVLDNKPSDDDTQFLNTPTIDSSLGHSLLSSPESKDTLPHSIQYRQKRELAQIIKRHHCIVWSLSIILTLIPFCTGSMGLNIASMSDNEMIERDIQCWIGSKFWVFSFYSVVTVAVLNGLCILLFISFKILNNREHSPTRPCDYNNRSRIRHSTGVTRATRNYRILNRFGLFVGCYLFCWILPIIRRYYAALIDEHDIPEWLILSSEVSIAIFPMANAIVWYTNPSFRKLVGEHLILIIKYDCCCCCHPCNGHQYTNNNNKPEQNKRAFIHLRVSKSHSYEKQEATDKDMKQSTAGCNTLTTNTAVSYGSFCDIMDIATYSSNYSCVKDSKVIGEEEEISSDCGMRSDDMEDTASFGGTMDTPMDIEPIRFTKEKVQAMRLPSHLSTLSDVMLSTCSSSLSEEMKREHQKYSSDFAPAKIGIVITPPTTDNNREIFVITPRDDVNRRRVVTPRERQFVNSKPQLNKECNLSPRVHRLASGLFTDDEEYEDKVKKFQNSIDDFEEDTQNESD
eukprot:738496_1